MPILGIAASSRAKAFKPTDLSNLYLWLDADDATTFSYSSGVIVSQWNDKSGNGYHAAQATVANQPSRTTSPSAVSFDGSNDMLVTTATYNGTTFTQFLIAQLGAAYTGTYVGGDATTDIYFPYNSAGTHYLQTNNDWGTFTTAIGTSAIQCAEIRYDGGGATNADKMKYRFDGTDRTLSFTGTIASTLSRASSTGIGAYNNAGTPSTPLNAKICEVVTYSRILNATELGQVRTYLNTKWGVNT